MSDAKQRDLLKCKTKADVMAFAAKHRLPTKKTGNEIQVGGWICIMEGDKFLYIK